MYKSAQQIIYSASDLIVYMQSPFASWMARQKIENPDALVGIEKDQDEMMGLLADKGNTHEKDFLTHLIEEQGADNVAVISDDRRIAAGATQDAMQKGYPYIFQAYLQRDNFSGFADFLIRREGKSNLGDYYYEAWDTKLSLSVKPYFLIQLCCYSWMLELIQGVRPEEAVVVLGNKEEQRFRIAAYDSYFQSLKQQFITVQQDFTGDQATLPDPALCTNHGAWGSYAKHLLEQSDSLALVANMRITQIKKLRSVGISTLSALATTTKSHIKGMTPETFDEIKAQAAIQLESRGLETPKFKVLIEDNGKGLSALPPASPLDIFFDIEGHPLEEGGLEYLWGVSYHDKQAAQGKEYAFKDWWGHNQEQEKQAFEGFIDWSYQRWKQDAALHIYHYASYEITAIRKLSIRYQTRLLETAELLKHHVFIDLYKLVKGGLLIGEPKYSIKNVEHLYRGKRTTDVENGSESIVFYEHWRENGGVEQWSQHDNGHKSWLAEPDKFDWPAWPDLNDIRDYNIDDCESTLELVDWLRKQQSQSAIQYSAPIEDDSQEDLEKTERQLRNAKKRQALVDRQQALITRFESDEQLKNDPKAELLISLLHFYDRERKPQIWAYFDRLEKTEDELFDDDTVVQDISIVETELEDNKLHCTATYHREQPIRTDKISSATLQGSEAKVSNIKFSDLNEQQGEISFTIKTESEEALQQSPLTLFGDETYINTETLENRLCGIAEQYFDAGELSGAVETLLNQSKPNFKGTTNPLPITRTRYPNDQNYLNAIIEAIKEMDHTCLCIQGPPGAGKTFTASHVISALIQQGKRIGIMSNSHAAIMNLLESVIKEKPNTEMAKIGGFGNNQDKFKVFIEEKGFKKLYYRTSMKFTGKQPYEHFQVVGATAYAFANEVAYETPLDYLFVDEASQVALANLMAVSGATKNIILMGDQMQLEQPIQGSHPGDSGAAALEFMLKEHSVIPEDKGVFLERTYRMHPNVCQPLSEIVYEGKLHTDDANKHQAITLAQPKIITHSNGILSITVNHEGNTQSSEEEVIVIQQLINELKTGTFTNKKGEESPITEKDILIVAPYNMQVNLLKEKLTGDLKIGTIDKFQGQEAPVVIISMAVSDVAESSRGLDFVFDINRLNVAVSRAQALAIIVANEGLEQCHVNSLGQMERVGFFVKLKYC